MKNGIIRFQQNNGSSAPDVFYEISLYFLLMGYFLFYSQRILMVLCVGIGALGSVVIVCDRIRSSTFRLPLNSIWYMLFFGFAQFSSIWAYSASRAFMTYLRVMLLILIVSIGVTQYVKTADNLMRVMKIFMLATLTSGFGEFLMTPMEAIKDGYFGGYFSNNNSNTFGYISLSSAVMSFYVAYVKKKKLWYALVPVFLAFCMLSSSRKAMFISLIGICLVVLFSFGKKRHWLHLCVISLSAVLVLFLSLKVPFLYDLIGYRIVTMLDFYQNDSQYTQLVNSLAVRDYFIEFAKQMFYEKPILGHGFANFATVLYNEGEVGFGVYAHNNYWEILADLGIIGFIFYYWFYLYMIIKLVVKFFINKNDDILAFGIPMILAVMVLEWGVVSMASFFPQFIISVIYTTTYADNSSAKKHRYSPALIGGR